MAEVETLALVNRPAHPFAEVGIVQSPLFLTVEVLQDLREVVKVEQIVPSVTKEPHDVLGRDHTILVEVKVKEGFPHGDPILGELLPEERRQLKQSLPHVSHLLLGQLLLLELFHLVEVVVCCGTCRVEFEIGLLVLYLVEVV